MIRLRPSGVDEILIKRVQDWYEPGPGVFIQSLTASFSPAMLFTGSTTGVWYDPSDTTTLFQDAAGTLPVTAVEQPVGLMLDKSKGLVLGPELVTNGDFSSDTWWLKGAGCAITGGAGVATAAGSGSGWYKTGLLAIGNYYEITFTVVSCSAGAFRVGFFATAYSQAYSAPGTYTVRLRADGTGFVVETVGITTGAIDNVSVKQVSGNHAFNSSGNSANFPVLSARYNLLTKTEDFSDAAWTKTAATLGSLVTAPDGSLTAQTVNFAGLTSEIKQTPSGTFSSTAFFAYVAVKGTAGETLNYGISSGADQVLTFNGQWQYINYTRTTSTPTLWFGTWSGATTRSFAVWHPDLRVANDALNQPAYQRVNTSTDYDTVGFKPYLKFNGTNQWLQTNSIDFTYGDKMLVCAGVRKLSDAATGTLLELSVNYSTVGNAFAIFHPETSTTSAFAAKGTLAVYYTPTVPSSPLSSVLSMQVNIAGATKSDAIIPRINGAVSQTGGVGATLGTGNYGNYPLYIGARAGTSVWFNGRLYQMVVAGKQASAAEITSTETYLNQKTGAF